MRLCNFTIKAPQEYRMNDVQVNHCHPGGILSVKMTNPLKYRLMVTYVGSHALAADLKEKAIKRQCHVSEQIARSGQG